MPARRRRVKKAEDGTPIPKQDPVTVKVFRAYTSSGALMSEDEGFEEIEVRKFEVEPAYISVNHGRTMNLGDYESARLDVRVSVPCYPEEINEALLYADKTAHDFLEDSIDEYVKEIK